jgi:hypothetical protein
MLGPIPIININKMSATDYKKHIGKPIKDFSDIEKLHYVNLRVRAHRKNKLKPGYKKYARDNK